LVPGPPRAVDEEVCRGVDDEQEVGEVEDHDGPDAERVHSGLPGLVKALFAALLMERPSLLNYSNHNRFFSFPEQKIFLFQKLYYKMT
jgi:hypothetical protein